MNWRKLLPARKASDVTDFLNLTAEEKPVFLKLREKYAEGGTPKAGIGKTSVIITGQSQDGRRVIYNQLFGFYEIAGTPIQQKVGREVYYELHFAALSSITQAGEIITKARPNTLLTLKYS